MLTVSAGASWLSRRRGHPLSPVPGNPLPKHLSARLQVTATRCPRGAPRSVPRLHRRPVEEEPTSAHLRSIRAEAKSGRIIWGIYDPQLRRLPQLTAASILKGLRHSARRWTTRGPNGRRSYAGKTSANAPQLLKAVALARRAPLSRPLKAEATRLSGFLHSAF